MAIAQAPRRGTHTFTRQPPLVYIGYAALAAIIAGWAWRAFHDPNPYDTGAAWIAGSVAWHTGHPETVAFWTGLPSLAGAMALISRVLSVHATATATTVLNLMLTAGAIVVVLRRMRPLIAPVWWWIAAFALVSFGPVMSTVWWKQFNLISLVLAAGGFELARRGRSASSGAVIGVSLAIKPMVILLPFVMLVRRRTRRAGTLALAWLIALNVLAQALMAIRAGQLGPLDPLSAVHNLLNKSRPSEFLCGGVNFSPGSLVCRAVGGYQLWTLQRIMAVCLLLLLGLWVISALRGRSILSWDAFAFICALSAMMSPFEWTHYQVMLAPLFLLLLFRFASEGASVGAWMGLVSAFVLASLMWQPYGTLFGTVRELLTGRTETYYPLTLVPEVTFQEGIAQFAQYILIVTGALWYSSRPLPATVRAGDASVVAPSSYPFCGLPSDERGAV